MIEHVGVRLYLKSDESDVHGEVEKVFYSWNELDDELKKLIEIARGWDWINE